MPIEKDTIENLQEYFMKKMHNHKKKETLMINFSVLIIWFLYTCTMIFFDINFNSKFLLIILSILFGINFSYFLKPGFSPTPILLNKVCISSKSGFVISGNCSSFLLLSIVGCEGIALAFSKIVFACS